MSQLKKKTQKILLDFSEVKDGKTVFSSSDFHLNLPKNITVHGYQPNTITAWLSVYKKKKVPVFLKTKGKLDPSLAISSVQIKPKESNHFMFTSRNKFYEDQGHKKQSHQ